MEQETRFAFGNAYGAFFGPSIYSDFYHNAAFQILLSVNNDIEVLDNDHNKKVGRIVLIKPLVKTKIQCIGPATHIYLSPRVSLAFDLIKLAGCSDVHIMTSENGLPFKASDSYQKVIEALENVDVLPTEGLDSRLLIVLEYLNQNLNNPSIKEAANHCGLSRSRIRTLAREQLGVPLSTWVTWRKLIASNRALSSGANLSEAALAGCFADQAHFTRTMKKMFGVTPAVALQVYT